MESSVTTKQYLTYISAYWVFYYTYDEGGSKTIFWGVGGVIVMKSKEQVNTLFNVHVHIYVIFENLVRFNMSNDSSAQWCKWQRNMVQ